MGLIKTMGKFCYVECDGENCNKKMEHIDEKILKDLAKLCGWVNRGNLWMCPDCVERSRKRKKAAKSTPRTKSGSLLKK